jgi:AcrR family transcriptional regulator
LVARSKAPPARAVNVRRRNPRTSRVIIRATLDLLERTRYQALTIEAIATEAGVGKATVYRWWPSKGALVAEAITSALVVEDPPETGDLRKDLIAAIEVSIENYLNPPGGVLIHALASDIAHDPALLSSFLDTFIRPRREVVARLIQRGSDEGLLPVDCDAELVMDMLAGALFYRGLFKHAPIDDDLAVHLVDAIFGAYLGGAQA